MSNPTFSDKAIDSIARQVWGAHRDSEDDRAFFAGEIDDYELDGRMWELDEEWDGIGADEKIPYCYAARVILTLIYDQVIDGIALIQYDQFEGLQYSLQTARDALDTAIAKTAEVENTLGWE
jgi:hypothetical protein